MTHHLLPRRKMASALASLTLFAALGVAHAQPQALATDKVGDWAAVFTDVSAVIDPLSGFLRGEISLNKCLVGVPAQVCIKNPTPTGAFFVEAVFYGGDGTRQAKNRHTLQVQVREGETHAHAILDGRFFLTVAKLRPLPPEGDASAK